MIVEFLNGLWAERYLIAGILAACLSVAAFLPYVVSIIGRQTKPDRACWLIWAVLSSLSGGSNVFEGAETSLFYVAAQVGGTLVVCALSFRFGSGHILNRANRIVLSIAALGVVSWVLTDRAIIALVLSIGVSALGGVRTVHKAYLDPKSEAGCAWSILLIASVFGLYSVGTYEPILLAYPVYLFILYAAVVGARCIGQRAILDAQSEAAWQNRRRNIPPITIQTAPVFRHKPASLGRGLT